MQRGHIQIAYYTWMVIGLYITLQFIWEIKINNYQIISFVKAKYFLLLSLILGFMFSLNIYYPILNYSSHSIRSVESGGAGLLYATQWSFSLKR